MSNKAEDQLIAETNVEAIEKKQLIKSERLPNSPFSLVTTEDGSFIAMGMYRLTEFKDEESCMIDYQTKNWELILAAVSVLMEVQKNPPFTQIS